MTGKLSVVLDETPAVQLLKLLVEGRTAERVAAESRAIADARAIAEARAFAEARAAAAKAEPATAGAGGS